MLEDGSAPWGARPSADIMMAMSGSGIYRSGSPLQWRHNERDDVSNRQPHDCLLNRLFSTGADHRHQSCALLDFVRGIYRWPVNSPHKEPVTRKMFPFDDVIMHREDIIMLPMVAVFDHYSVCMYMAQHLTVLGDCMITHLSKFLFLSMISIKNWWPRASIGNDASRVHKNIELYIVVIIFATLLSYLLNSGKMYWTGLHIQDAPFAPVPHTEFWGLAEMKIYSIEKSGFQFARLLQK